MTFNEYLIYKEMSEKPKNFKKEVLVIALKESLETIEHLQEKLCEISETLMLANSYPVGGIH